MAPPYADSSGRYSRLTKRLREEASRAKFSTIAHPLKVWSHGHVYDGERNPALGTSRVEPSGLEEYRRHHEFQAPSCLCALIDGDPYTETRIKMVERGERRGTYAAECVENRCGYIVYLEDFYTVLGLRIKKYARRVTPLEMDQLPEKYEGKEGKRTPVTVKAI
ncbi:hypothetical protein BKA70DRAFT_1450456 [Coprinopsis sp. MPI-PUGE-AT-0042]|nr:hypothetical protein BKA70DRAFT_1450456 [Coprinopsis sp. MPI-PUGE-AT-0042]